MTTFLIAYSMFVYLTIALDPSSSVIKGCSESKRQENMGTCLSPFETSLDTSFVWTINVIENVRETGILYLTFFIICSRTVKAFYILNVLNYSGFPSFAKKYKKHF